MGQPPALLRFLLEDCTFTVSSLGMAAAANELSLLNIDLVGINQTGLDYIPLG